MPLSYAELEQFYEGLVARAHHLGIPCAITSGMACVAFGVAQATKDCDLLCAPNAAGKFLDRVRLRIYERAVRPYMMAVKKERIPSVTALPIQHEIRVRCAESCLPTNPLLNYGIERLIAEARAALEQFVQPSVLAWLPDVREHF